MSQHADSRKPSLLTDLYHHFVLFPIEKNGGGTSTTVPGKPRSHAKNNLAVIG